MSLEDEFHNNFHFNEKTLIIRFNVNNNYKNLEN